ncbi:MAG: DUF1552 domain-containing protein [Planctomycetaceae bacterium]|nr:DUF1552 domain-containing protein [Planctomycetaceae bacterium]
MSIKRRSFLKAAGVALPLPWLESLAGAAPSGANPGRAVFFMVPSGVNMWRWHPKEFGPDYQLSSTLQSLAPVREELTIFSGLEHTNGAGGGHTEVGAWLTGNEKFKDIHGPTEPNAISIDQHIARSIGDRTRIPSLVLSAPGGSVTTSFDAAGAPVNAENNLRRLFGELFGAPDVMARLQSRASVIDIVGDEARGLSRQLSRNDRNRFDDYLQSVRDVEGRLQKDREYFSSRPLSISGDDLPLDADPQAQRQEYFRTMLDLVALALRNDQTRIVSILACGSAHEFFGRWPDFGNFTGHHSVSHDLGHFDTEEQRPLQYAFMEGVDKWFIAHLAHFLQTLNDTREGDATLLANTMVLYGGGMSWTHNPSNLPMLLAGGSRLGLKHGSHLRFNPHKDFKGQLDRNVKRDETTVCDVLRTMSERLGVPAEGFGNSRRVVNELLVG